MITDMKRKLARAPANRLPERGSAIRLATASQRSANDPSANWWMITFSDLTVLLLGFAVLWHVTATSSVAPAPAQVARPAEPQTRAEALPAEASMGLQTWQAVQNDLAEFVGAAGLSRDVAIESAGGEILLSMRDSVSFDSAKADLRSQALPVLDKIAAVVLANAKISVAVSGHTDRVRIANPAFPSNWELSTARATRVARYLIQRGLRPSIIAVQGYADQRPSNHNFTPAARRANRRVEIRLFQTSATDTDARAKQ
jgi:chemotaxis protein MotB